MNLQLFTRQLKEVLSSMPEVSLVYLFGSQVEGNTGPLSDVDLGVLVDRGVDEEALIARLSSELAAALPGERLDLILLQRAPVELMYAVIAGGVCLYERDPLTRVEFEAGVLSRYGDYLPVLRNQRQEILRGEDHERRVQRYRAALRRTERTLGQITASKR